MTDRDTLAQVAEEVGLAFAPLTQALESPASFAALMWELGWDLPVIPDPISSIGVPLNRLIDLVTAGDVDASSLAAVLDSIRGVINAIQGISSQPASVFPPTIDSAEFASEFPRQVVDFLLADYLVAQHPPWGQVLRTLGIIRLQDVAAAGKRPPYVKRVVAWEDLAHVLSDPSAVFRDAWLWGSATFRQEEWLNSILDLVSSLGMSSYLEPLDPAVRDILSNGGAGPDPIHDWVLRVPLIGDPRSDRTVEIGIGVFMLPPTPASERGFAVLPYAKGTSAVEIALTDTLNFTVAASFDLEGGAALLVYPDRPPELIFDIISSAGTHTAAPSATEMAIGLVTTGGTPLVILGSTQGSRLEVGGASIKIGARVASKGKLDIFGEVGLRDSRIIVRPASGESDGFLSTLLPGDGIRADFSFGVGLSTAQGIYFSGSGGLEIQLPVHVQIGPIEVLSATLTLKVASGSLPIDLGATIKGDLGPLKASVENLGLRILTTFPPNNQGNLGPVNLGLAFKPPNGVGLSINAGIVQGGGFLYIDSDRGEYAGALELVFADFLSLHAIGLITTKMPDGSSGFSLLVIITAEFGTGIQLGFGFTLLGVGGLLGLNRTMLLQPLLNGVRTGSINSIMFPQNVVANAPRIISDLRAIFPPQEGSFLIGPMAKLGWGTPTLISLALGIIIEIPGNIAILGVLKLALPADDAALIVIQVNFAGAIEFDKKRMYFFASLFDSRVLFITIEGEMGVLFGFGDNANFVISVGGFHPQYTPPPLPFPNPRRIEIDILNESYARIRCDGYFSVTSDTVQFGAHVDMFFGFSAVSVSGHIGFDALIQFSPFHFVVSFSASFSVQVFGLGLFGIDIEAQLSGPAPWNVHGKASLSFLFFSIGINIDVTWGDSRNTLLPPIAVMPLLSAEFSKQSNWRAVLPGSSHLLVTLRKLSEAEAAFVLHPVGTLRISQRAVPLDLTLNKIGNQKPNDANYFTLTVASADLAKRAKLQEQFAPSQFQNFDDSTKLSQPGYELMDSGIELSAAGTSLASGTAITRVVRYDLTVIDTKYRRYSKRFFSQAGALFNHFLGGASVTKCTLSAYRAAQMQPVSVKVAVGPETFAVALRSNNTVFSAEAVAFTSQAVAHDYLNRAVASNPSLAGTLHVLPQFEVTA